MKFRTFLLAAAILALPFITASAAGSDSDPAAMTVIEIPLTEDENVWGAYVNTGSEMPFAVGAQGNLFTANRSNQTQPLLLTDKGRYVWCDEPFCYKIKEDSIEISVRQGVEVKTGVAGSTLAEARTYAADNFFPTSGQLPPEEFFTKPQYNTWIELLYYQNQAGVLEYARNILKNGLPAGIIMIDDTWQEDYGKWTFHPGRFPDPKAMIDELHDMGFKVMLWICPFVSMDQYLICREINGFKGFLLSPESVPGDWETSSQPYPVRWWNGTSAVLDFSNPQSVEWFRKQLDNLTENYGVDGFKFDAGDFNFYPMDAVSKGGYLPADQCKAFSEIGIQYPYNEFRASWKMGGQPLVQRLQDKVHSWTDLQKLIPEMLVQNLLGYTFSCPDMIGGGSMESFLVKSKIDQDLIVRSAQCHALMTMMQFSVAPWRILDERHLDAVLKSVQIREKMLPKIMELVKASAETGSTIMNSMEYAFPGNGYAQIKDQFVLGTDIIVAPMLAPGEGTRTVVLPKGKWRADDGTVYRGGKTVTVTVPLDRIPYFEKIR